MLDITQCTNFTTQRQTLMSKIGYIDANILGETETSIIEILLLERKDFKKQLNR